MLTSKKDARKSCASFLEMSRHRPFTDLLPYYSSGFILKFLGEADGSIELEKSYIQLEKILQFYIQLEKILHST